MISGAQKFATAQSGRCSNTEPTSSQSTRFVECNNGNCGPHSDEVAVAQKSGPTRMMEGSGKSPGITGFLYVSALAPPAAGNNTSSTFKPFISATLPIDTLTAPLEIANE